LNYSQADSGIPLDSTGSEFALMMAWPYLADGLEVLAQLLSWRVTPDLDESGTTSPLPTRPTLMTDLAVTAG
jgi:hypothetical protein